MKKLSLFLIALLFIVVSTNAQQGKMHAGGQVGISIPVGTLSDFAKIGFVIQGNYLYGVHANVDLSGSLGYISWGTKSENVSVHVIPITFGARYYFQRGNLSPYGLAELGLNFGSTTVDYPSYFGFGGGSQSVSSTDIGLDLGGGFLYDLGSFQLDFTAKFNIVSDHNNLSVLAGVLFPIN